MCRSSSKGSDELGRSTAASARASARSSSWPARSSRATSSTSASSRPPPASCWGCRRRTRVSAAFPTPTPVMRQYREAKEQHPDGILLFRLGDFYEIFFDDAKIAAPIMGVQLTSRPLGKSGRAPMCGVPHHAWQTYIGRLLRAGHKVVICDQVEAATKKRSSAATSHGCSRPAPSSRMHTSSHRAPTISSQPGRRDWSRASRHAKSRPASCFSASCRVTACSRRSSVSPRPSC